MRYDSPYKEVMRHNMCLGRGTARFHQKPIVVESPDFHLDKYMIYWLNVMILGTLTGDYIPLIEKGYGYYDKDSIRMLLKFTQKKTYKKDQKHYDGQEYIINIKK